MGVRQHLTHMGTLIRFQLLIPQCHCWGFHTRLSKETNCNWNATYMVHSNGSSPVDLVEAHILNPISWVDHCHLCLSILQFPGVPMTLIKALFTSVAVKVHFSFSKLIFSMTMEGHWMLDEGRSFGLFTSLSSSLSWLPDSVTQLMVTLTFTGSSLGFYDQISAVCFGVRGFRGRLFLDREIKLMAPSLSIS